jgi:hypothetical protein
MRQHFTTAYVMTPSQDVKKTSPARSPQRPVPSLSQEQSKLFSGLEHSAFSLDRFAKGFDPVSSAK